MRTVLKRKAEGGDSLADGFSKAVYRAVRISNQWSEPLKTANNKLDESGFCFRLEKARVRNGRTVGSVVKINPGRSGIACGNPC